MKIKANDKVKVLAGKDRGKTGKVLQVLVKEQRASVEGLNLLIKHLRPQRRGEKGQRVEFPAPMNLSNLAIVCPKCGKTCRVGFDIKKTTVSDKEVTKKVRICKKCHKSID